MRTSADKPPIHEVSGAALAFFLWFVTFYLGGPNFWLKITLSSLALAVYASWRGALEQNVLSFDLKAIGQGVVAAAALYAIFWAGGEISSFVLPFAGTEIADIYGKGPGFPRPVVFFLLLVVTGPCEELFWRGFLQKGLMDRYGRWAGFVLTTAVYSLVHLWSFNFMLVCAALVAGAFWGSLYMRLGRLDVVIVSHALWSSVIFAVFPVA